MLSAIKGHAGLCAIRENFRDFLAAERRRFPFDQENWKSRHRIFHYTSLPGTRPMRSQYDPTTFNISLQGIASS